MLRTRRRSTTRTRIGLGAVLVLAGSLGAAFLALGDDGASPSDDDGHTVRKRDQEGTLPEAHAERIPPNAESSPESPARSSSADASQRADPPEREIDWVLEGRIMGLGDLDADMLRIRVRGNNKHRDAPATPEYFTIPVTELVQAGPEDRLTVHLFVSGSLLAEDAVPIASAYLAADKRTRNLYCELSIESDSVLLGKVVDHEGNPLEGVQVGAFSADEIGRPSPPGTDTRSLSDGSWALTELPAEEFVLCLATHAYPPRTMRMGEVRGPVDLGRVALERGSSLSGRVGGPASILDMGVQLLVYSELRYQEFSWRGMSLAWDEDQLQHAALIVTSNSDGSFETNAVCVGAYEVSFQGLGVRGCSLRGSRYTHLEVMAPAHGLYVPLAEPMVWLQVFDEAGMPIEEFEVSVPEQRVRSGVAMRKRYLPYCSRSLQAVQQSIVQFLQQVAMLGGRRVSQRTILTLLLLCACSPEQTAPFEPTGFIWLDSDCARGPTEGEAFLVFTERNKWNDAVRSIDYGMKGKVVYVEVGAVGSDIRSLVVTLHGNYVVLMAGIMTDMGLGPIEPRVLGHESSACLQDGMLYIEAVVKYGTGETSVSERWKWAFPFEN